MPADARVAPCPGVRVSITCTRDPHFANSYATVHPTMPAPTTITEGGFTSSRLLVEFRDAQANRPDCRGGCDGHTSQRAKPRADQDTDRRPRHRRVFRRAARRGAE